MEEEALKKESEQTTKHQNEMKKVFSLVKEELDKKDKSIEVEKEKSQKLEVAFELKLKEMERKRIAQTTNNITLEQRNELQTAFNSMKEDLAKRDKCIKYEQEKAKNLEIRCTELQKEVEAAKDQSAHQ
jgi:hypothetical protein